MLQVYLAAGSGGVLFGGGFGVGIGYSTWVLPVVTYRSALDRASRSKLRWFGSRLEILRF